MAAISETSTQLALRDPDTRLMIRVRDEEPGAFEELVERYQARLVALMHHLVGNADEAEDLAQEVETLRKQLQSVQQQLDSQTTRQEGQNRKTTPPSSTPQETAP